MFRKNRSKNANREFFGFGKKKSLTKRFQRIMLLTALIIFAVSSVLNWNFMQFEFFTLFSLDGNTTLKYAQHIMNDIDGLEEYAGNVVDIYRSIPENIRKNRDSAEYRAYFSGVMESDVYRRVREEFSEITDNQTPEEVYVGFYDPENLALVYIINPVTGLVSEGHEPGDWEPVGKEELAAFLNRVEETQALTETGTAAKPRETGKKSLPASYAADLNYIRYNEARQGEISTGEKLFDYGTDCPILLIVDIPQAVVTITATVFMVIYFIVLGVILLIILLIARVWMQKRMIRPIRQISDAAENYARDKINGKPEDFSFGNLQLKTRDELAELAAVLADMEKDIAASEKKLVKAASERQRITTELSVAAQIQENMLPKLAPPVAGRYEFEIFATMNPAKEVGGDFYDFFMIDDQHIGLVMADVSGKGIPAALFMMSSMIIIDNFASMGYSPAKVLELSNEKICEMSLVDMFVTVWFGILDLRTGTVTAANAGHEYPVVQSEDGTYTLMKDRHGFVVGGMGGIRYKDYSFTLHPGTSLFLYTDGLPEATDEHDEFYGTERMIRALDECGNCSPKELLGKVKEDVARFSGGAAQFDDLTMMCIKYYGSDPQDEEKT